MNAPAFIYKICPRDLWRRSQDAGLLVGSALDEADGFLHFSAASQVAGTLARYFEGREDLVLLAVATEPLGDALRWETSTGGAEFPHLYAPLPLDLISAIHPLPLDAHGAHILPWDS